MARKFSFSTYDKKHLRNLLQRAQNLSDIFGTVAQKAINIGEATGFCNPQGEFLFDKFPAVKERVEQLFQGLHDNLLLTVTEGNREEWLLSAAKNDAMVDSLFGHVAKYGERAKDWKQPNLNALEAFQNRKERGMNLSDRVWRLTNQFKGELEMALELGLGDGKSAAALSKDVRQYLNEPHKLFRRVRNEKGQLRLSKSAAAYHPGQGVYRSSYKNALRLTVTENNMAYRTADHERWQQLDFVIGIEILLSNNHPCEDICDEFAGVYPKTFKFVGWHPFCRCIAVPKLADEDEFIARMNAEIAGEDVPEGGYVGEVTEMPEAFSNWVQNNAERIENAKTVPYFISDNKDAFTKARAQVDKDRKAINSAMVETVRGNTAVQKQHLENMDGQDELQVKAIRKDTGVDEATAKEFLDAIKGYSYQWDWEIRQVQCGNLDFKSKHGHALKEVQKKAQLIEEYIEKAPKWAGGDTYRGMAMSSEGVKELIADLKQKCGVGMRGCSSWSTEQKISESYWIDNLYIPDWKGREQTEQVLLICKKQRNATSIRHLSKNGMETPYECPGYDEYEVLASMKEKYRFLSVRTETDKYGTVTHYIEVEAI